MRLSPLFLWLALASCDRASPIDDALRARAEAAVAGAGDPAVRVQRLWMADRGKQQGLICGRLDAANPLVVHETGRAFIYDDRARKLQLQPSRSPQASQAEAAFQTLWVARCAQGDR